MSQGYEALLVERGFLVFQEKKANQILLDRFLNPLIGCRYSSYITTM
ncbi:hypothetical protein D1BOALGB6SA_8204 [Olavius sp. associated proteobacterium Delta 1]|nr:hypothetical protein D1BOALGB6SA_8204 [Olavius sp. associated proteobacterium Delta 1]